MEREWLAERLEAGRSIESIARETGRSASTVAYWVNEHGLASGHARKHRAKGPVERARLEELVEEGRSIRQIAEALALSPASIRHWLTKYGLKTRPLKYALRGEAKPATIVRECSLHGWATFVRGGNGRYRCGQCNAESVAARRRRIKEILVREAGGCCRICGFAEYVGALHFHHLDRERKAFAVSRQGVTRALARAREEARKCVLLCANCHAMVEAGLVQVAVPADHHG